ncbi:hypothetical protein [Mesorhizobium sp. 43Arga]
MTEPALDLFLSGLRTAWKEGEIRPTANLKPKQKRTSRELLERLQAEYPEKYPDLLLRTLQRRMKICRKEKAHAMVFGTPAVTIVKTMTT